jgi:hypothetical protein
MEIIKKKILTSDLLKGDVHMKIQLNQKIDDMGISTDMPYGSYSLNRKNGDELLFGHYTSSDLTKHYSQGGTITYITDSKLQSVKSYDANEPYKEDLDMNVESYQNYKNVRVNGVDRVTSTGTTEDDEVTYVTGAEKNINIGTTGQTTGILFIDNPIDGLNSNSAEINENMITKSQFQSEGWNGTNTSLDPEVREEYLFGIINTPEVQSDVFIDRGAVSVLDRHLRLSEVESLDHLERYGNGYYNINRD